MIQMTTYEDVAVKVLDKLTEVSGVGPVTAQELSASLGDAKTTTRYALLYLEAQGMVFKRPETPDERKLRFGHDKSLGRQANLYSIINPVPARTTRGVFAGVVESGVRLGSGRRIAMVLDRLRDADHPLTSVDLAEMCGTTTENISGCLLSLVRAGKVERSGRRGSLYLYTLAPKRSTRAKKIAAAAASTSTVVTTEIVAEDPTPSRALAPTASTPTVDLVRAIDAVVESRVAALTADLQADNARLVEERDAALATLASIRASLGL